MLVAIASPMERSEFSAGTNSDVFRARGIRDVRCRVGSAKLPVGFLTKSAVGETVAVDEHLAALVVSSSKEPREPDVHHESQPSRGRRRRADAHRVELRGRGRSSRGTSPARILSEAAHVEHGGTLPSRWRSHRHYLADGITPMRRFPSRGCERRSRALRAPGPQFSFPFRQRRLPFFRVPPFDVTSSGRIP